MYCTVNVCLKGNYICTKPLHGSRYHDIIFDSVTKTSTDFIVCEGLIPKNSLREGASGAIIRVLNPRQIPYLNNHTPSVL
jgi:hypothetical protein